MTVRIKKAGLTEAEVRRHFDELSSACGVHNSEFQKKIDKYFFKGKLRFGPETLSLVENSFGTTYLCRSEELVPIAAEDAERIFSSQQAKELARLDRIKARRNQPVDESDE
jgi:hypothetical protein